MHTRRTILATLALLMMALTGTNRATAIAFGASSAGHDQVNGTFTSIFGTTFHIDAISGPNGEDARGHFYVEQRNPDTGAVELDLAGFVTCLNVLDNRAMVGGVIDRANTEFPLPGEGNGILLFVEDDGSPGDGDIVNGLALVEPIDVCPLIRITNVQMRGNMIVFDEE